MVHILGRENKGLKAIHTTNAKTRLFLYINHVRQRAKESYFQSVCPIIRPRFSDTIFDLQQRWLSQKKT